MGGYILGTREASTCTYSPTRSLMLFLLTSIQSFYCILLRFRSRTSPSLPDIHAGDSHSGLPSLCLLKRSIYGCCPELYPRTSSLPYSSFNSLRINCPPHHVPWFRGVVRICNWRWALPQDPEGWIREGFREAWRVIRQRGSCEEIAW